MATDEDKKKFQEELLKSKSSRQDWCICNLVKMLIIKLKGTLK